MPHQAPADAASEKLSAPGGGECRGFYIVGRFAIGGTSAKRPSGIVSRTERPVPPWADTAGKNLLERFPGDSAAGAAMMGQRRDLQGVGMSMSPPANIMVTNDGDRGIQFREQTPEPDMVRVFLEPLMPELLDGQAGRSSG